VKNQNSGKIKLATPLPDENEPGGVRVKRQTA